LADKVKEAFGIEVQMIPSGGGVFEVICQGEKIASKKETGLFPEEEAVLKAMRALKD
jgi:selenoprotein W-related protein